MIWMSDQPLVPGGLYLLKIGTGMVPETVTALKHRIDVETWSHLRIGRSGSTKSGSAICRHRRLLRSILTMSAGPGALS